MRAGGSGIAVACGETSHSILGGVEAWGLWAVVGVDGVATTMQLSTLGVHGSRGVSTEHQLRVTPYWHGFVAIVCAHHHMAFESIFQE